MLLCLEAGAGAAMMCQIAAMPAVVRIGGLRVMIYPNDHLPAHVHVLGPGREAVFVLDCADGPPRLRQSFGFGARELNQVEAVL